MASKGRLGVAAVTAVATALGWSPAVAAEPAAAALVQSRAGGMCRGDFVKATSQDRALAQEVASGTLTLPNWPGYQLPRNEISGLVDPSWSENLANDLNWRFQFLSLQWLDRLRRVGAATGDAAMLLEWERLLRDSVEDFDPQVSTDSPSVLDMALGMRSVFLACAVARLGPVQWLADAVTEHAEAMMSPALYAGKGNHAMHHNTGLLILGWIADRSVWLQTALDRQTALMQKSVDSQGVIDEGSIGYQWSNYRWWTDARTFIETTGMPLPSYWRYIDRMPDLMAYAVEPDGMPVNIGDTHLVPQQYIRDTMSEYAATAGERGVQPTYLNRLYRAGYAIGRSSWEKSNFDKASFWTMRFGPAVAGQVHGHHDHGSITFSSLGNRLIGDQGLYAYWGGEMRGYVRSAQAHNVVTVDGVRYDINADSPVIRYVDNAQYTLTTVEIRSQSGVSWTRTLFYSKRGRYLLVDDRVNQLDGKVRTAVQRFHLGADRELALAPGAAHTSGPGADLGVFQVGAKPSMSVVKGQQTPLLGWRSPSYYEADPVPVLESRLTGAAVRFTTALVARPAGALASSIRVYDATRTASAASMTVQAGSVVERVDLTATGAKVVRIR